MAEVKERSVLASNLSPHTDWLRRIRTAAREWVKDYQPAADITPIEEVRLTFLGYMQEEQTGLLKLVFSQFAPPQTVMACLWNYCGQDIKKALVARGWETTPNALDVIGTHVGARDLLIRQPNREDEKEYISLVIGLLGHKRDRRENLARNSLESVKELDDRINTYRSWMTRKASLI